MALIPYYYRPSVALRRNVVRQGILGGSPFWRVVAVGYYGRRFVKRYMGRQPETLGVYNLGMGAFLTVATSKPVRRRAARRAGITLAALRAKADADAQAALDQL
ncbi:MAG: hypothetical protein AAFY28_22495 [Actinomycetota bacterium]